MTIQKEIVEWAAGRPAWQQGVLCDLAAGKELSNSDLEALLREIKGGGSPSRTLKEQDIPVATSTSATVSLGGVRDLKNVNALISAQDLTFAQGGLTVIYGDNGSGKSGYARVLKSAVRSLHREPVHGNVFAAEPEAPQSAEILYSSNGESLVSQWPSSASSELSAVSFYDEACGDAYVEKESELGYRPSALLLLDGLIEVCDRLAEMLAAELSANAARVKGLPDVPEGTSAAGFLACLSGRTERDQLGKACDLPGDHENELAGLRQEEVRLRASDPENEISRLKKVAIDLAILSDRLDELEKGLDDEAARDCQATLDRLTSAREAARIASAESFDSEPLDGVGSESWQILWRAAREFSRREAYPDREFPVTREASCVLCQQSLSAEAGERLQRFDAFVGDVATRELEEAEAKLDAAKDRLLASGQTPFGQAAAMTKLGERDQTLASRVEDWLEVTEARRLALLAAIADGRSAELPDLAASPRDAVARLLQAVEAEAGEVDETRFKATLDDVFTRKEEIEGRQTLARRRADVEQEIQRLAEREGIEAAKRETDTKGITRKTTELTEKYVTTEVRDRFARETDRLELERIHLAPSGGRKGKLRQRPELLGAKAARSVAEVFSEGEQTALGLAGYFTEAHFDASRSALVLDDPVSSLDHIRRRHVAKRVAELAADRQVVVFTHELEFVVDLSRNALEQKVDFAERAIERRGSTPGVCVDEHPWKAKDVGRRIDELFQLLAEIKRERSNWGQNQYEQKCAEWAGKLSEAWERVLHLEVAQSIFDPSTSEVRPRMLKVLARITEEDDRQFQESYSRASEWARRHDKSPSRNYVAPEPQALEKEFESIRDFVKRIKTYKN